MNRNLIHFTFSKNKNCSEKLFDSNPKNIELLFDITEDSYTHHSLDNTFTIFKSFNDIIYVIYSNQFNSIISYDLLMK